VPWSSCSWLPGQRSTGSIEYGDAALVFAAKYDPAEAVAALLAAGAEVDTADGFGSTALMHAAEHGHVAMVKQLVAAGAAVDRASEYGDTALLLAAGSDAAAVVDVLVAAAADVGLADGSGRTALQAAAARARPAAVAALLALPCIHSCIAAAEAVIGDDGFHEYEDAEGAEAAVLRTALVRDAFARWHLRRARRPCAGLAACRPRWRPRWRRRRLLA
jgi:hypothetical protein